MNTRTAHPALASAVLLATGISASSAAAGPPPSPAGCTATFSVRLDVRDCTAAPAGAPGATPSARILGYDDPPAPTPPPATPPATPASDQPTSKPKPADPVPSLDELLGTKPAPVAPSPAPADSGKPAPTEPAETLDPARSDLDRLLKGNEIGDAFTEAVRLMNDAATRLEGAGDTGITTQRVQEDVIRRLDQLLASLQRRQSSSSSSGSSSSSQDNQAQRNQPNQKKPAKGAKPGQNQQNQSGSGERRDLGPPRQDGQLRPALDSARAAWGSLPERIRDMLLQGSSDRFSSKYQAMTEAYYRRLAEEKK